MSIFNALPLASLMIAISAPTLAGSLGSAPKRIASGITDGDVRPIACPRNSKTCKAGKQLDTLLAKLGLGAGSTTSVGQIFGIFARSDGFVVTARLLKLEAKSPRWRRRNWDTCRLELVDLAIAITDNPVRRSEFEEHYLLRLRTRTLDLTPSQRARIVSNYRIATIAVRLEIDCLLPKRRYTKHLRNNAIRNLLLSLVPGLPSMIDLR